jgi:hypothetical protein
MRPPLSDAALAACTLSDDELAGRVFATPAGKLWLAANEHRFPDMVAETRQRVRRMRLTWGDKSTD